MARVAVLDPIGSVDLTSGKFLTYVAGSIVLSSSASGFSLANSGRGQTYAFTGSFTAFAADGHPTAGTVTAFTISDPGALTFQVTNTSFDVGLLYQSNASAFWSAVLAGSDTITGGGGNDVLVGGSGANVMDGGPGINTVAYTAARSNYTISNNANGTWTVVDTRVGTPDGSDTLTNIQYLRFSDGTYVLAAGSLITPTVNGELQAVLRADATYAPVGAFASSLPPGLAGGSLANSVVQQARSTSSVATLAYEFFTGGAPSAAGMDYLVSPTGPNPNNLNSAYYQSFGLENRYINFASNLGSAGAGSAQFAAQYGNLTPEQAMTKAYQTIFGGTPSADKVSHLLHDLVPNGVGGSYERLAYFQSYGGDGPSGIGTKAAMVGWLLAEAVKADLGTYALSNDAFLTDVALHNAPYGVDIIGHYAQAGFVYQPG